MKSSELIDLLKSTNLKTAEEILEFIRAMETPEIDKVLELVKIVESHDIGEIEVARWGSKIRVSKTGSGVVYQASPAVQAQPAVHSDDSSAHTTTAKSNLLEIKSPMVGTFYQAPAPDAQPYVKVGDHISAGQPLCIIEAMKIMNVIEAEISGKVTRILAENGQPVEYDQPLFVIE